MNPADFKNRALCLWLPQWSIQRHYTARPELRNRPFVIYEEYPPGTYRIVDCCPIARSLGLRPLMPASRARTISRVHFEKNTPYLDSGYLKKIAEVCELFSPTIAIQEPDCLFMNVTGLAKLFGGQESLVSLIRKKFESLHLVTRIAIADTYIAAWGLTHFSKRSVTIVPPGNNLSAISSLPVAALDLPVHVESVLSELGVHKIQQLLNIPRSSLTARFEPILIDRLDQAIGLFGETHCYHHHTPRLVSTLQFEAPVNNREYLESAIFELLQQVVKILTEQQKGISKFKCVFLLDDFSLTHITISLFQATTNIKQLSELAQLQLERHPFSSPVSQVRLIVCETPLLQANQLEMFHDDNVAEQKLSFAGLANRLSSRLGYSSVSIPILVPDAKAEFAFTYQPLLERKRHSKIKSRSYSTSLRRPTLLLPKPVALQHCRVAQSKLLQFSWNSNSFLVKSLIGPERIQTGWWRGGYAQRDYYRVETQNGNCFWIFRQKHDAWFLHGVFD